MNPSAQKTASSRLSNVWDATGKPLSHRQTVVWPQGSVLPDRPQQSQPASTFSIYRLPGLDGAGAAGLRLSFRTLRWLAGSYLAWTMAEPSSVERAPNVQLRS
jgi:hypothetical protein